MYWLKGQFLKIKLFTISKKMNFVKEKGWVKKITIFTILWLHTLATVQTLKRLTNFRYCMTRSAHFSRSSGLRRALPRSIVSRVRRDMLWRFTNFWTHGTDGRLLTKLDVLPARLRLDWTESNSSFLVIGKPAAAIANTQSTTAFSSSAVK